ncbi:hypothetical protein CC2G_006360 [Coprinopsis cinerea AmutBmut pab1-1]|nr:hypothetical protein CC2G_006360 [Coprinopsis cinerea AmutBmut pab1-1]
MAVRAPLPSFGLVLSKLSEESSYLAPQNVMTRAPVDFMKTIDCRMPNYDDYWLWEGESFSDDEYEDEDETDTIFDCVPTTSQPYVPSLVTSKDPCSYRSTSPVSPFNLPLQKENGTLTLLP